MERVEMAAGGELLVDEKWLQMALCVSRATVMRWRDNGTLPSPVRLPGRMLRWRRSDIEAWVASDGRVGQDNRMRRSG